MRRKVHLAIDRLRLTKEWSRTRTYKFISNIVGYEFHAGKIETKEEGVEIINTIDVLIRDASAYEIEKIERDIRALFGDVTERDKGAFNSTGNIPLG